MSKGVENPEEISDIFVHLIRPVPTSSYKHIEVGTGARRVRMSSVFFNTSISYFTVSKDSLDNEEDVFNFASNTGFFDIQYTDPNQIQKPILVNEDGYGY